MLKEQQEEHLHRKSRQCGDIEHHKMLEKRPKTLILYPIVPYKKVGTQEIAHYGKFKRYHRRDNIALKVAATEDVVGTQP